MPVGRTNDVNAAEILSSANARSVFDMLRQRFHFAVVDTPPINTVTDVGIIGQMCYGVILLVRVNQTRESMAKHSIRLLQANNINILGCMVIGTHEGDSPYTYYYNRYYRHYYISGKKGSGT